MKKLASAVFAAVAMAIAPVAIDRWLTPTFARAHTGAISAWVGAPT